MNPSARQRKRCSQMRLPLGIGLILLWWAAGSAGQPAVGAEPAREPEPAIRWRRIYAPADRLKEWPFGPLRYVPVEAAEFEQLWSAARIMASASAPVPLAARITTARYQARLVDDQFVEGEAFLEVVHGGKTPLLLPLDPCGLTIGKARWLEPADAARGGGKGKPAPRGTKSQGPAATPVAAVGPEKAGNFREAVIGLRPDGKLALLVERSGVLWWQWSLRGRRNTAGTIHFPFQLPACLTNRLIVDLPERQRPKADHEMVEDLGPAGTGYRRWQVECGGHSHVEVRVTATAAAEEPSQLTVLRQSSLYDFSLRGIDVSAQWTLDVRDQPLRQLVVALDPELQLVSARLGNRPLPWSATAAPGHGANLTVLEMPEPIQGTGQTLRLAALAPLPSLSVGRSWRLPRIRLEGAFWQQGSATLLVPFPLLVEQFFPDGCRQSGTAPLPSPRLGESMQFECFSPDASLAIVLTHGQPKIQLNSATTLEWGNGEIKGRVVGDFQVIDGETFSLKAEVNKPWIVDSVESIPRDAMDDWNVDESGGRSRLGIILAKALSPSRPIRLQITARRLYFQLDPQLGFDEPAPGKRLHGAEAHAPLPGRNQRFAELGRSERFPELGLDELVPLHFPAQGGERLVAVNVSEGYKLNSAELLHRLIPPRLTPQQLELFGEPPRQLVLREAPAAAGVRITLEPSLPSYTATIRVEATLSPAAARDTFQIQEAFWLRCVPESSPVDRLLVHFSHRRDAEINWELDSPAGEELSARRLPAAEQAAALLSQEEAWELKFRPRSGPFEIHGVRGKPGDPQMVSLVSLPEASAQSGTLIIRSVGGPPEATPLRIKSLRLTPITVDPAPAGTRAAYRYNPSHDASVSLESPVAISRSGQIATPPGWAWSCELRSRYQANGRADHLAVYRLQNLACSRLRLTLPPGVAAENVQNVWVDRTPTAWQRLDGQQPTTLLIDLPPGEKFPTVAIDYTTSEGRLGMLGALQPRLPQCSLPILTRHWTAWLPPGYESVDAPPMPSGSAPAGPTSSQRVFGPLGRGPQGMDWDPLAAPAWASAGQDQAAREAARQKVESWLQAVGALTPANLPATSANPAASAAGWTWSKLLSRDTLRQTPFTLLIDRDALAELGITPQTALPAAPGDTPGARGVSLLDQSNLALLLRGETVLLTSQTAAAIAHAWLMPLKPGPLWWLLPGPLADQLRDATAGGSTAMIPAQLWRDDLADRPLPWNTAHLEGDEPSDSYGWSAYRFDIPPTLCQLHFVHSRTVQLISWSAFLAVVAGGWWMTASRPAWLVLMAALVGIVALFVPLSYISIASCTVLGLLYALLQRLVFPRRAAARETGPDKSLSIPSTLSGPTRIAVGLLAVMAVAIQGRAAWGQPPAPRLSTPGAATYDVFIPTDDQQQPISGKYYVPDEFYRQLYRRGGETLDKPQGWLISQAVYRGVLAWQAAPERLAVSELRAIYDLRVFGQATRVRIPLTVGSESGITPERSSRLARPDKLGAGSTRREAANLVLDAILLDGRAVRPEWDPATNNPVILVSEPGPYRLELLLQPLLRPVGMQTGFDFPIPPLATARLELLVPLAAPAIEVPTALGSIRREEEPARITAELGPASRLSVQWQQGARRNGSAAAVDVDELLWLKVQPGSKTQPGSVVLDAKFKFRLLEGHLREVQLSADPCLRLLPSKQEDLPIAQIETTPGPPQIIRWELARPIADQGVLQASFLLTGTTGVGNLRLPELDVLGARQINRCLAVSVDDSLAYQQRSPQQPLETMTVPDFMDDWGITEAQPEFAYRLPPGRTSWSLSTQPRKVQTRVDQSLDLSFGPASAEVQYEAQLETTGGYCFEHQLTAPRELTIERISLTDPSVERAARWSQDAKGQITLFLTSPVSGKQALTLSGRLPTGTRKMPLPLVQFDQGEIQSSSIRIYRRPSVLVQVEKPQGLLAAEVESIDAPKRDPGRLVKAFKADGKQPARAWVLLKPNHPTLLAEQTIRLRPSGSAWEVQTDFLIHVKEKGAVLDQIKISAPSSWNAPYQITPPELHEIVPAPDGSRQLVVKPKTAISGTYRLSITAPLLLGPEYRVSVPDIRLPNATVGKRLLLLPAQHEGQPVVWNFSGLKRTDLPTDFKPLPAPGSVVVYQIVRDRFQATLRRQSQTGVARVGLADISVASNSDGACRGVAVFEFLPGGSSHFPLSLPAGCQLVHVSVAGVAVTPESADGNSWRVPLSLGPLPQPVEVLFTGTVRPGAASGSVRFDAPSAGELNVEHTLWTIGTAQAAGSRRFPGGTALDALHAATLRVENRVALFDLGSATPLGETEDLTRWYELWAQRLSVARVTLRHELAYAQLGSTSQNEALASARAALEALEQRQTQITGWLAPRTSTAPAPEAAGQPDQVELWGATAGPRQSLRQGLFSGGVESVTLAQSAVEAAPLRDRLLYAAGIAACAAVLLVVLRYPTLSRWFRARSHVVAVLVGVTWWMWLSPSVLGWAIVVLSLVTWLLARHRRRARRVALSVDA